MPTGDLPQDCESTDERSTESAVTSVQDFLRMIVRSKLLDAPQVTSIVRSLPRERRHDLTFVTNHFITSGRLTRYQAGKLMRGQAAGMIVGPYRLLSPLGKGGMGSVFLVRDKRNDQLAALKVLPPKVAREEERMLARFRREMELSQQLTHPHVCWTYEVGEYRGVYFIAMEFIPGLTLSKLVHRDGPLVPDHAAALMSEVASGLHHAHELGIIHRDLKPSNIMITPRDHAKILDVGLALRQGETGGDTLVIGGQGYIVGSMDYISPEQTHNAAKVDARSDLYSLGCTLYFALTGRPPFPGGTSREKIRRHRTETPTPISELVPDLPIGLVRLVERLMCKSPAGRPTSAQEAEQELRTWATEHAAMLTYMADETLDEQDLIKAGPPSSEYNLVSLPEVDLETEITGAEPEAALEEISSFVEEKPRPEPVREPEQAKEPIWLVPAMAMVLVFLLVAGVLLLAQLWK